MKKNSAFTLIEILLYIAILGTLAGAISSVFFTFISSNEIATQQNELTASGDQISRVINQTLRNADSFASPNSGESATQLLYLDEAGNSQLLDIGSYVNSPMTVSNINFINRSAALGRLDDKAGTLGGVNCPVGFNCPNLGVAGQIGDGIELNNSQMRFEDPDGATNYNGLTAFTLSVWVNSDITNSDQGILIGQNPVGNDDGLGLRYDANGFLGGCVNCIKAGISVDTGSGTDILQFETTSNTQSTAWQHLVIAWTSGQSLQFYINGVNNPGTAISPPSSGTITDVGTLIIGQGAKDTGNSSWDGLIDEIRLWDFELSAAEINEVYTTGSLAADPLGISYFDFDNGNISETLEYSFTLNLENQSQEFNSTVTAK